MKRSIGIDRRIHKGIAFSRNRNVPFGEILEISDTNCAFDKEADVKKLNRRTSYDGPPDKYDNVFLHYQLKPVLLMLRALGSFPVDITKSGW